MSQPLLRPSFTADISSLDRRVGNLERRTTPRPVTAAAAPTSDIPISSNAFFQRLETIPSSTTYTEIYFGPSDLAFDNSPSGPFWLLTSGAPISYQPGIYSVVSAIAGTIPAGTAGKTVTWDTYGFIHYQVIGEEMAGDLVSLTWEEVVTVPKDPGLYYGISYNGNRLRLKHQFGVSVGLYVGLFVTKIGNTDG